MRSTFPEKSSTQMKPGACSMSVCGKGANGAATFCGTTPAAEGHWNDRSGMFRTVTMDTRRLRASVGSDGTLSIVSA